MILTFCREYIISLSLLLVPATKHDNRIRVVVVTNAPSSVILNPGSAPDSVYSVEKKKKKNVSFYFIFFQSHHIIVELGARKIESNICVYRSSY